MPLIGLSFSTSSLAYLSTIPHKLRSQVIKKAKALILNPYPQGCKKLQGMTTAMDEPIYRQRSGDYRILYVIRGNPNQVVIINIDHRKDIYE